MWVGVGFGPHWHVMGFRNRPAGQLFGTHRPLWHILHLPHSGVASALGWYIRRVPSRRRCRYVRRISRMRVGEYTGRGRCRWPYERQAHRYVPSWQAIEVRIARFCNREGVRPWPFGTPRRNGTVEAVSAFPKVLCRVKSVCALLEVGFPGTCTGTSHHSTG